MPISKVQIKWPKDREFHHKKGANDSVPQYARYEILVHIKRIYSIMVTTSRA